MKMARANIEWVPQVSLLRPGFLLANWSWPEHPGLKIETWATQPGCREIGSAGVSVAGTNPGLKRETWATRFCCGGNESAIFAEGTSFVAMTGVKPRKL
jgi:hypothetical protein